MTPILLEQMKLLTGIVTSEKTSAELKAEAQKRLERMFLITDMQITIAERDTKEYLDSTSPILKG